MTFEVVFRKKTYEFEENMSVKKVLKRICISSESYLVVRDGKLLTENDMIKDGEIIKIISVISGGTA